MKTAQENEKNSDSSNDSSCLNNTTCSNNSNHRNNSDSSNNSNNRNNSENMNSKNSKNSSSSSSNNKTGKSEYQKQPYPACAAQHALLVLFSASEAVSSFETAGWLRELGQSGGALGLLGQCFLVGIGCCKV